MYPVLGTMMPEICEAPHLPEIPFIHHRAPYLMVGDAFISFSRIPHGVKTGLRCPKGFIPNSYPFRMLR